MQKPPSSDPVDSEDPTSDRFLTEAIALSVANISVGGGPFGAVIVKDGQVIARGKNRVTASHDPTAHAEIVAIRAACAALGTFTLAGCVLYSSCEPCPMCLAACYWARLDAIHFAATRDDAAAAGFDDAFLYEELTRPLDQRRLPTTPASPTLRAAAREAFAAWAGEPERTAY